MSSRFTRLALSVVALCAAIPASASAATTVGENCPVVSGQIGQVGFDLVSPSQAIPSNGVITEWGFNIAVSASTFPIELVTSSGSGLVRTITGASEIQSVGPGAFSFKTRMAAKAGDRIGSAGVVLFCAGTPTNSFDYAAVAGFPTPGQAITMTDNQAGAKGGVWAKLEADADGDGFGDETQDSCPQSAKYQTACPVANALGTAKAGRSGIAINFANPGETTLSAAAKVKIPKHGKHRARTLKFKTKPVAILNGSPGKLSLKYPSALKSALKSLSKKKKLKVTITVTSTGLANTAAKTYYVKLPGRHK